MGVLRDPMKRFWSKVDLSGDCWIWTGSVANGYGEFLLHDSYEYGRTKMNAHRMSLLFHGVDPGENQVHHTCLEKRCVNPAHLEIVSSREHGEKHRHWTKEAIILEIRIFARIYGEEPTSIDWNPAMARALGHLDRVQRWENNYWPSTDIVQKRFGSWGNAIEEAGFPRPKVGRKSRLRAVARMSL